MGEYKVGSDVYYSVIPELNTTTDSNPGGYCNYAREEPLADRCLNCSCTPCEHRGEKTLFKQ